ALGLDLTPQADPLGLAGGASLLREESLWVGLGAQRPFLPALLLGVASEQVENVPLTHGSPPPTIFPTPWRRPPSVATRRSSSQRHQKRHVRNYMVAIRARQAESCY